MPLLTIFWNSEVLVQLSEKKHFYRPISSGEVLRRWYDPKILLISLSCAIRRQFLKSSSDLRLVRCWQSFLMQSFWNMLATSRIFWRKINIFPMSYIKRCRMIWQSYWYKFKGRRSSCVGGNPKKRLETFVILWFQLWRHWWRHHYD